MANPFLLAVPLLLAASAGEARPLSLAEAERYAEAHQALIAAARATTEASEAKVDVARAPLLPQVTGSAQYARQTANSVPRGGAVVASGIGSGSMTSYNSWSFGVNASQTIWDFGQVRLGVTAQTELARAQQASLQATRQGALYAVRVAYATAWANRALADVARDNLANQERHLAQIEGFVRAGTRPEIDLAQARADRANAVLGAVNADNAYAGAKAQLASAMGWERLDDFDVTGDRVAPIAGEEGDLGALVREASTRPDARAAAHTLEGQRASLGSARAGVYPTLTAQAGVSEGGSAIDNLAWNWNVGAAMSWPIFQGGVTRAQVRAAEANTRAGEAQVDLVRQQARLDVTQARLAVRAARASIEAAHEAEASARERLRLAEGRYQAGAGSILELSDAQLAATSASAQVVQAALNLSVARAALAKALGRDG